MPVSELVFPVLKPATAKEALSTFREAAKSLDSISVLLSSQIGHVLSVNGANVSDEYRIVMGLEWESLEGFFSIFPSSEIFQNLIGTIAPFLEAKATPQLFQSLRDDSGTTSCFQSGVTHIFKGIGDIKSEEATRAWNRLVESLDEQDPERNIQRWNGFGIEAAERSWVGILGWNEIEDLDIATKSDGISKSITELKEIGKLEEFVVRFG